MKKLKNYTITIENEFIFPVTVNIKVKMISHIGMSYKFSIVVYRDGQFLDLRSLTTNEVNNLRIVIEQQFNGNLYDHITTSVEVTNQNKYGELNMDTEVNDPSVQTFLEFWVSPRMMRVSQDTQVRLELVKQHPY